MLNPSHSLHPLWQDCLHYDLLAPAGQPLPWPPTCALREPGLPLMATLLHVTITPISSSSVPSSHSLSYFPALEILILDPHTRAFSASVRGPGQQILHVKLVCGYFQEAVLSVLSSLARIPSSLKSQWVPGWICAIESLG